MEKRINNEGDSVRLNAVNYIKKNTLLQYRNDHAMLGMICLRVLGILFIIVGMITISLVMENTLEKQKLWSLIAGICF